MVKLPPVAVTLDFNLKIFEFIGNVNVENAFSSTPKLIKVPAGPKFGTTLCGVKSLGVKKYLLPFLYVVTVVAVFALPSSEPVIGSVNVFAPPIV